jgi:hypothetical protein
MAYYDALVVKWATLTGTTDQKLTSINALTVAKGSANPAILTPSQIINACVPADIASLTSAQVTLFTLLLQGGTVDASVGTTVRAGIIAIFTGKTTTMNQLGALVAPFDSPTIPWWQATVTQGGGGLSGPIGPNDLIGAGGLV